MANLSTTQNNRLDWVDAAKGLSILLVVMMYSAYSVGEDTDGIGFLHYLIAFATPFRMPEFFLISGLFLSQVIDRPWAKFADRRVVHYLYFYLIWMVIHVAFKVGLVAGDPMGALSQIVVSLFEPYGVLWFIYVLAMVSAATKLLHTLNVPKWAGFAGAAVLQLAPISTGIYAVDQFCAFFVCFYAGAIAAPWIFRVVEAALARPTEATIYLVLWAIINGSLVFSPGFEILPVHFEMGLAGLPGVHLVLAIAGALALCVAAALLTRHKIMGWLTKLGSLSLVVYLAFALPMSVVRVLAIKVGLTDANLLSLMVFATAVIAPLVLHWLIKRTGWGTFLFARPAIAHIPGTPGSRSANRDATAVPAE